jgi:hypothetical protein
MFLEQSRVSLIFFFKFSQKFIKPNSILLRYNTNLIGKIIFANNKMGAVKISSKLLEDDNDDFFDVTAHSDDENDVAMED